MNTGCQRDGQITRRTNINIKGKVLNTLYYITGFFQSLLSKRNIDICINYLLLIELNKSYQSRLVARRAISPSFRIPKENLRYNLFNTPPPPLLNVPKRGFSL